MKKPLLALSLFIWISVSAQPPMNLQRVVDSLRTAHQIPGLWVGVVSPDSVLLSASFGVKRAGLTDSTNPSDIIALGSCRESIKKCGATGIVSLTD